MFVEEAGNPAGPPLLLVHGFLSSNTQWDLNRNELGAHHRLLMVELPGHGRSSAPVDAQGYTIESLVAQLEAVRLAHKVDRWWVCGQSLGGAISILYCLAHPEHVHGLIFTNTRAAFGIKRPGVSGEGVSGEGVSGEGVSGEDGVAPKITSTRDLAVHPINAKRLPEPTKQRMIDAADAMPIGAVTHFLQRRHTWKSTAQMAELTMPVLLVNGRWEKAFQPFVDQARALIADLRVVTLEGGHAINVEQPEQFNQAVMEFTGTWRNGA